MNKKEQALQKKEKKIDLSKEEIKGLETEEELIRNQIDQIMFINEFSPEEIDELWTRINQLIDNQIETRDILTNE